MSQRPSLMALTWLLSFPWGFLARFSLTFFAQFKANASPWWKTKELKSLIYEYKDKKEQEIKELNENHYKLKNEIEKNQKNYEKLIDEAADEISSFVEKAKLENLS